MHPTLSRECSSAGRREGISPLRFPQHKVVLYLLQAAALGLRHKEGSKEGGQNPDRGENKEYQPRSQCQQDGERQADDEIPKPIREGRRAHGGPPGSQGKDLPKHYPYYAAPAEREADFEERQTRDRYPARRPSRLYTDREKHYSEDGHAQRHAQSPKHERPLAPHPIHHEQDHHHGYHHG